MANIKPLGQRVLVKRIEAEAISSGGIVLPDTAKEKPQEAEVLICFLTRASTMRGPRVRSPNLQVSLTN